jgi:1-deoxy-D-xylulose-5-phosphate reductoisomerase
MPTSRRIAILGSTGSIGLSALSVVEQHADRLEIVGLAAGANVERLAGQVARFRPRAVAMATSEAVDRLRQMQPDGLPRAVGVGRDGLAEVATHPDVDLVLCASAGTDGLEAVLAAIDAGKTIALANKEVLVMAGGIVMEAARRRGVAVLPVDSEHNAVHQCLDGRRPEDVRRLILTASGGPFRGFTPADLRLVGPEQALRHPTWRMGRKITIDSATLMNKGLEVIEARWLFDMPVDRIDVVVHPQSVVHSMVEFVDGSIIAQLGVTDMRLPIQYAFAYPSRWSAPVPPLDLVRTGPLEFAAPDLECFPCLSLAREAIGGEPGLPVVLNAANEMAVASFLDGQIGFMAIPEIVGDAMRAHRPRAVRTLADVRAVDDWARDYVRDLLPQLSVRSSRQSCS